jgi:hypothetical protein
LKWSKQHQENAKALRCAPTQLRFHESRAERVRHDRFIAKLIGQHPRQHPNRLLARFVRLDPAVGTSPVFDIVEIKPARSG